MTCCQLKTWKYLTVEKSSPQYKISGVCGEEAFDALGEEARNFHLELRRQKALQRRILQAKLPKLKTLAEYKFESETLRKAIKPTSSRIQSQIQAQTALAPSGCAVKQSPETCAPFGV